MIITKYRTIMFNDSLFISLLQFIARLIKLSMSVSITNSNLKPCTVTATKDAHKYQKKKKKSDICHRAHNFRHFCIFSKILSLILFLEKKYLIFAFY